MNHNPQYPLTNVFVQDLKSVIYPIPAGRAADEPLPTAIFVGDNAGLPPLQQAPLKYHLTMYSLRVSLARQHGERGDWRSPEVAKGRHGEHGQLPHVDPRGGQGHGDTSVMKAFHDSSLLADKLIVTKYN